MKKLVFATLMCIAAISANAQVLTSETVKNVYETVSNQTENGFVFNADWTGKDLTTMYVYKSSSRKGVVSLKPHMKYEYTYATDGTLASRVTYLWNDNQGEWSCAARYDYSLVGGTYCAEYSRYNHIANRFDQPTDKMVYFLTPYDNANSVSYYHRNRPSSQFQLISETLVSDLPILLAKK